MLQLLQFKRARGFGPHGGGGPQRPTIFLKQVASVDFASRVKRGKSATTASREDSRTRRRQSCRAAPQAGKSRSEWDDASTVDALYHAGPIRIADHAADQVDRGSYSFRLGSGGADLQEALRGLCDEHRPVGQPARCVAHSSARRISRGAGPMIMVITSYRSHSETDENQRDRLQRKRKVFTMDERDR
jgi:hypothetical protein